MVSSYKVKWLAWFGILIKFVSSTGLEIPGKDKTIDLCKLVWFGLGSNWQEKEVTGLRKTCAIPFRMFPITQN